METETIIILSLIFILSVAILYFSGYLTSNTSNATNPPTPTPPNPTPPNPITPTGTTQRLAIPAYFDPTNSENSDDPWVRINNAIPRVNIVYGGPSNGPGSSKLDNYAKQIALTQSRGCQWLGYVHASGGNRPYQEVLTDIDNWYKWYNVDGIFIDEVEDTTGVPYITILYNAIKSKPGKATVILNRAGVHNGPNSQNYVNICDTMCTFEGTSADYVNYVQESWMNNYPATKFLHIIFTTPQSSLASTINRSKTKNVAYLYVTPLSEPNPFIDLPPQDYWNQELSLL
jgi:hypothetical protein